MLLLDMMELLASDMKEATHDDMCLSCKTAIKAALRQTPSC